MTDNECFKVYKTLLNVTRVPIAAVIALLERGTLPPQVYFAQVLLTYEIILVNNCDHTLHNVSVTDTLAGISFNQGLYTVPFNSSLQILQCSDTLIANSHIDAEGQLLDVKKSYIPPHTTSKILLNVALSAPDDTIAEVRQVQNSVCVDGKYKCKKIDTIVERSAIWSTESDISLLIGINFNFNFST